DRRARGAAGREQVVDDQHLLSLVDRVAVHLEAVGAVFERVAHADRRVRKLPDLAYGNEARADPIRDRGAEDEPAALDPDDERDAVPAVRIRERVDRETESLRVAQERRDVVKENAGFRKVRHVANAILECLHGYLIENPVLRPSGAQSSTCTASTREA